MTKKQSVPKQAPRLRVGKVSEFRPQTENANKHTPKGLGALRKAMQSSGYVSPVTAVADGEVIDGSARIETAYDAFPDEALIIEHDGTRPIVAVRTDIKSAKSAKAKRIAIEANRIAQIDLDWDIDVLKDMPADVLEGLFDADDLASMGLDAGANAEGVDAEPQIDKAAELAKKWGTARGQVWRLGEHRLMCGDSTSAEDVARLMKGERAHLCFTSPPYGQQRDYTAEGKEKVSDWDGLMRGVFGNLPMAEAGQVLVNLGMIHKDGEWVPYWDGWIEWMRSNGWKRFGWYVWDQGNGFPGENQGRLAPCFEFVFHFNKSRLLASDVKQNKTAGQVGGGGRLESGGYRAPDKKPIVAEKGRRDAVARINRATGDNMGHPAVFPAALVSYFVESWPGATVYEPFSGSGTTIMACEQLGRKCRAMEIAPEYVAVALERWATATGKTPERVKDK